MIGLTASEAKAELRKGNGNIQSEKSQKTVKDIIRENTFTYFNLIFLVISILLIVAGSFNSLTFLPVIFANMIIGIVQEIYAKNVLDKLSIINAPNIICLRDGTETRVKVEELVCRDVIVLHSGDQIPADARVLDGQVYVNEALLTGESDEIEKNPEDELMSGSFVVSGTCRAELIRVGKNSYINKLMQEAKALPQGEQSEMVRSIDNMVRFMGILLIPIGVTLFVQSYYFKGDIFSESVTSMVAAVIGMIPEGLYLLVSVTLAMSAVRLAVKQVMLHNMKSIEALARVDVLCVDKTGTITDTKMLVCDVISPEDSGEYDLFQVTETEVDDLELEKAKRKREPSKPAETEKIMHITKEQTVRIGSYLKALSDDNMTMMAMREFFEENNTYKAVNGMNFSSKYKFSAVQFKDATYVFGAPDVLLCASDIDCSDLVNNYSNRGYRVLLFAKYGEGSVDVPKDGNLIQKVTPEFFVLLQNPVRENAKRTFAYFKKQGVTIKVISGDNPRTVSEVSKQANISGAEKYIDARELTNNQDILNAVREYTVFGRVTPEQKRMIVKALKYDGHTVAMTGDGVNDILAMKDADCSIAMASGSDAAVQSSQVVLLDSDFSHLPQIVSEGRRVINNIQRSASLFLVKNIFSLLLAIFAIASILNYPLKPAQITLISAFNIGIPAFFLALEPSHQRIQGRFMRKVLIKSLPAALTDFFAIAFLVEFGRVFNVNSTDISVAATFLLAIVGFIILLNIATPLNIYRGVVIVGCMIGLAVTAYYLNSLFEINVISQRCFMLFTLFAIATEPFMRYLTMIGDWLEEKENNRVYKEKKHKFRKDKF
ncbi:MAG: cation-translocating P-type ATPase [Lachnospiraceae bacterium]|nr:cation-translocating P-type ATPase [Lachnospiraceae bacterium]